MDREMASRAVNSLLETVAMKCSMVVLVVLLTVTLVVLPAGARGPDWNYSTSDKDISSVAISSGGDLIAAGAERVLFFSRDGTLLGDEPYGTSIMMTPDGKYTASAYFATIYFFQNPRPGGPAGMQKATKLWERELTRQVYSIDLSRDGSLIVGKTEDKSIFTINTRTVASEGNDYQIDNVVKVSPDGRRIIGISKSEIHSYSLTGLLTHTADLTTFSVPHTVLLPVNGTFAVFNDGQIIRCVNSYNGTERWKRQVTGYVNTLSMTSDGSAVIAGTEAGIIERLDGQGNPVWRYASNQDNRPGAGISCSAVADHGGTAVAGTDDGKILFLDARGDLSGSFDAKEKIRHIAISSDGTTVVATGKNTVYTFFLPSALPAATTIPFPDATLPSPEKSPGPASGTVSAPITEVPTTSAVIRTATRSPASFITLCGALLLALLVLARKR
jgi:WD40 repeat protein